MTITNVGAIKRAHQRFLGAHDKMVDLELTNAGFFGVEYAERHPRFTPRSRTGHGLRDSNESQVVRTRGGKLLRLKNRKKYAAAIDKGARPHDIKARNAPFLVFYWPKKGRWVRTKRVKHPGNRPYRFLYGAQQATYRQLGGNLRQHMRRIARRF